jgi:hypothetical protein
LAPKYFDAYNNRAMQYNKKGETAKCTSSAQVIVLRG